jgi:hypothetical protein
MRLDQDMAGPVGEPLSLLWGPRYVRLIPATRARQLRDEDMSGRYPTHVYQSDLPSQQPSVFCSKCMRYQRNHE